MRRFLLGALVAALLVPGSVSAALADNVRGRILLQVESRGEAWYVDPVTDERFYLANGDMAYLALRAYGLGITNADLSKIPVGVESRFQEQDGDGDGLGDNLEVALGTPWGDTDADDDGFSDYAEVLNGYNPLGPGTLTYNQELTNRLKGRILLQVEGRGEAWYVHPEDGRRYYMADGNAAYQIMRYLSLGITDADLEQVPISSIGWQETICPNNDYACFKNTIEQNTSSRMNITDATLAQVFLGEAGEFLEQRMELSFIAQAGNSVARLRYYTAYADIQFPEEYIARLMAEEGMTRQEVLDAEVQVRENIQQLVGYDIRCEVADRQALADMIGRWGEGKISSGDYDPFTCTDNAEDLGFVSQFGG